MTSSEADRIVDELCELTPAERLQRLDALGLDAGMRIQVERVLAHVDALMAEPDALPGPVVPVVPRSDAPPPAGGPLPDSIGPYAVKAWLGAGGMGVVYRAEQAEPRRDVALKLLHTRLLDPSQVRRFEREADLLGRLQHPGIAQIHAMERTQEGEAFLVMEFIEGRRLTDHADRAALSRDARVALLIDLAEAVHHAHLRGVLHRDLKPANVLVTDAGQVKVIDFGVARALDGDAQGTLETRTGQLVGTLTYMSPEQLRAEPAAVDGRADVYALGVLAYELLGGALPHDVTTLSLAAAARVVCEQEPPPLGRVAPGCRGDLECIVGQALEKDPVRRYQSAQALADDLRRHLADEPVHARPPSAWYQARRFARRHRGLVAGLAMTLVAILIGAGVAVDQAVTNRALAERESEARQEADELALTARRAATEAARNAEAAEAAATLARDEAARAEAEAQAAEQARQAEAERADELATVLDLQQSIIGLVEVARLADFLTQGLLDGVTRQAVIEGDDVEARREAARAILDAVDMSELARRNLRFLMLDPMRRLIDYMVADKPGVRARLLSRLADSQLILDYGDDAVQTLLEAIADQITALGPGHPEVLANQVKLGGVLQSQRRDAEAGALLRALEEPVTRILGAEHPLALQLALHLSIDRYTFGDLQHAIAILRPIIEPLRSVPEGYEGLRPTGYETLARFLTEAGQLEEAEVHYREALAAYAAQGFGDQPQSARLRADYAVALDRMGRTEEAVALLELAGEQFERHLGRLHSDTRSHRAKLAAFHADDRPEEARRLLLEAIEGDREALQAGAMTPYDVAEMARRLARLAYLERRIGSPDVARRHAAEAQTLAGAIPRGSPDVLGKLDELRQALLDLRTRWPDEDWGSWTEDLVPGDTP